MQIKKLCFNDILLVPQYSELESRTIPDISTHIGNVKLDIPIISSPMDSITGEEMLVTMDKLGGLGVLSRYISSDPDQELDKQVREIRYARNRGAINIGCAIGIKYNIKNRARCLLKAGCNVICIDVAHGDHCQVHKAISNLRQLKREHDFALMAGNVCTPEATIQFAELGVDAIKIGIGPGAACTTRIVTGFGYPQMSAIMECTSYLRRQYPNVAIIADGGIRNSGDMVKSLWGGASACMVGYMLAGTSDVPKVDGNRIYRGMSSRMASGRPDIAPEGIEIAIKYKGKTEDIVLDYSKGIRSGLAMCGAKNLNELRVNADYIVVSPLSMEETLPRQSEM